MRYFIIFGSLMLLLSVSVGIGYAYQDSNPPSSTLMSSSSRAEAIAKLRTIVAQAKKGAPTDKECTPPSHVCRVDNWYRCCNSDEKCGKQGAMPICIH